MKVVINKCYGGFGLSEKAVMEYAKLKGITLYSHEEGISTHYTTIPWEEYQKLRDEGKTKASSYYFTIYDVPRNDPNLVEVVKTLGEEANGFAAQLEIVDIPDDVKWEVEEYDGLEWVSEKHRTWG